MAVSTRYIALQCQTCNEVIISRARHDFNSCACPDTYVFIDGDSCIDNDNYIRWGMGKGMKQFYVDLPLTRKQVYDDWNNNKDKLRWIDTKKYPLIEIPVEEPVNK